MRASLPLSFVATLLLTACVGPSAETKGDCVPEKPESLAPNVLSSIHIGMTRAQVEALLGKPGYSPTDGQDYYGIGGECKGETERFIPCTLVIEYRDTSDRPKDTGRVTGCFWGWVGE